MRELRLPSSTFTRSAPELAWLRPVRCSSKVLVEKLGMPGVNGPAEASEAASYFTDLRAAAFDRLVTLEFSRARKSMSVLCRDKVSAVRPASASSLSEHGHARVASPGVEAFRLARRALLRRSRLNRMCSL